jgi:LuxR family maltose regulon positive regulatory protein
MLTPLLATKLYIPRARPNLVPRPRLIARLNEGMACPFTLVSSPAGFGKTTLLSEWIPQSQRRVVWVSLDEGENDPTRLWAYFIAALQGLETSLGKKAMAFLQSPPPFALESFQNTLLNEIAAFPEPFALVLDDYQVIESSAIHGALAFLIDHLPPPMHLIVTTTCLVIFCAIACSRRSRSACLSCIAAPQRGSHSPIARTRPFTTPARPGTGNSPCN